MCFGYRAPSSVRTAAPCSGGARFSDLTKNGPFGDCRCSCLVLNKDSAFPEVHITSSESPRGGPAFKGSETQTNCGIPLACSIVVQTGHHPDVHPSGPLFHRRGSGHFVSLARLLPWRLPSALQTGQASLPRRAGLPRALTTPHSHLPSGGSG